MRMNVTDEALALAAAQGDRVAFASLLDRVYDRLFADEILLSFYEAHQKG